MHDLIEATGAPNKDCKEIIYILNLLLTCSMRNEDSTFKLAPCIIIVKLLTVATALIFNISKHENIFIYYIREVFLKLNYQALFGTSFDPETKMGEEASSLSLLFECFALQQCKKLVASTSLRWSMPFFLSGISRIPILLYSSPLFEDCNSSIIFLICIAVGLQSKFLSFLIFSR